MFETLITDVLARFLGDYVEEGSFDDHNTRADVLGGHLVLETLPLRTSSSSASASSSVSSDSDLDGDGDMDVDDELFFPNRETRPVAPAPVPSPAKSSRSTESKKAKNKESKNISTSAPSVSQKGGPRRDALASWRNLYNICRRSC